MAWRHGAIAASGICFDGHIPLCTENLNPDMVVMRFAQNQEQFDGSGSLNRCLRTKFYQSSAKLKPEKSIKSTLTDLLKSRNLISLLV